MSVLQRREQPDDAATFGTRLSSERSLLAAVFVTHGLLDGLLTGAVFWVTRGNGVESNPLLVELTGGFYRWMVFGNGPLNQALETGVYADLYLGLFVVATKVFIVGVLCYAAWRAIPNGRLYRLWLGAVAAVGAIVVANNLVGLLL